MRDLLCIGSFNDLARKGHADELEATHSGGAAHREVAKRVLD